MARRSLGPAVSDNGRQAINPVVHVLLLLASPGPAVKLGRVLNVKMMIVGEYTVLEGVRFLNESLVDVESGRIERSATTVEGKYGKVSLIPRAPTMRFQLALDI